MHKKILLWACIFGALAVAIGAFGTHYIKPKLEPKYFESFQTGVQYQFYHTMALLATGLMYRSYRNILITAAAYLFVLGILFFSFSLYAYSLSSLATNGVEKTFAAITPVGGVFFILGWIMLIIYFIKNNEKNTSSKSSE